MIDVIDNLSTLTTIDVKTISKLIKKIDYCICDAVADATQQHTSTCFFDLGFGVLGVDISSNDVIRYNFIPSKDLEKNLISVIKTGESPLSTRVEKTLVEKITSTYKDLF